MSMITSPRAFSQPIPSEPEALWHLTKRILFAVARKVRQAVRLKLEGHGRGEAEPEELVNDAFVCLVEALPRFNPATAKFTTFVYGLARRRMWLVARAAFYGLSPEQLHRMDAVKHTPRYHHGMRVLRVRAASAESASERPSVRKVRAIEQRLPKPDRRLVALYLQEGGNFSAVARRLRHSSSGVSGRYRRLFRRIAAAV
jgi:DNA-directed RNA polymerase specialized sigma24 family protein